MQNELNLHIIKNCIPRKYKNYQEDNILNELTDSKTILLNINEKHQNEIFFRNRSKVMTRVYFDIHHLDHARIDIRGSYYNLEIDCF